MSLHGQKDSNTLSKFVVCAGRWCVVLASLLDILFSVCICFFRRGGGDRRSRETEERFIKRIKWFGTGSPSGIINHSFHLFVHLSFLSWVFFFFQNVSGFYSNFFFLVILFSFFLPLPRWDSTVSPHLQVDIGRLLRWQLVDERRSGCGQNGVFNRWRQIKLMMMLLRLLMEEMIQMIQRRLLLLRRVH